MAPSDPAPPPELRRPPRPVAPWLVLGLGLVVTAIVASLLHRMAAVADQQRFARLVQRSTTAITDSLEAYRTLLHGVAGLFAAHQPLELEQFRSYLARVDLGRVSPGTLGLGFSHRLEARNLEHVRRLVESQQGKLWSERARDGEDVASIRAALAAGEERHGIVFLEPANEMNRQALGYDMFSQPVRRAAMERARDEGAAVASGLVTLVQEVAREARERQPGFLIYVPVYAGGVVPKDVAERRQKLVGFVYTPLRAHDVLSSALLKTLGEPVVVEVFSGKTTDPAALLYSTRPPGHSPSGYVSDDGKDILEQPFTFRVSATPGFADQSAARFEPWLAIAGVLLSSLLAASWWAQARARAAAETNAELRRLEEERLRQSERNFQALFEKAPGLYAVLDPELRLVSASDAWLEATMTRREDVLGHDFFEVFPEAPDGAGNEATGNLRASLRRVLATGAADTMAVQHYPIRRPDGTWEDRWWSPVNSPVKDVRDPSRVAFVIHRVEDVTAYVKLREAQVARADLDERGLRELADRMEAELFLRARELQEANARLRAANDELGEHKSDLERIVRERTKELRESHQRLRLSERMASLGTLAAGLGHDMGNLLLPVQVRLDALDRAALPEEARADVHAIRTAADYLRRVSSGLRLLALDPTKEGSGEPTELNAWWSDVQPILEAMLPAAVRLEGRFPQACWVAMARPALTQVVFNLVQNAGDALRERGSGRVSLSAERDRAGTSVQLSVADDGPGMTEEVKRRCMEPFFSTKTRGLSTGLGLVLVFGLTEEAGGSVEIRSEPGKGTTFVLTLPVAAPPLAATRTPRRAVVAMHDARLRSFVAAELRALGYSVSLDAKDAAAAELVVVEPREGQPVPVFDGTAKIVFCGDTLPPRAPAARVTALGRRPKTAVLRAALAAAAGDSRDGVTRPEAHG